MAEFCPNCRKLLAEGEICDCGKEPIEITETNISADLPYEKVSEETKVQAERTIEETCCACAHKISGIVKYFFKKPYSCTLKASKHISFTSSMILICIQAITTGIFSLVLIEQLVGKDSMWLPFVDRILGLGGWFRYWRTSFHIPYVEIFIKVILLVFLLFFILAGLFYIAGKLSGHKEGSFKRITSALSITSIINSATFIIATILLPFVPFLILFLLLFAFVFRLLLNHGGICNVFDIPPNKSIYSTSLVYLIYFLILNLFSFEALISSFRNF